MEVIFKLCLVLGLVTMLTVFMRHVDATILQPPTQDSQTFVPSNQSWVPGKCNMGVFVDETKRDLAWPDNLAGKCLVECMLETNDMLGSNGLIDVEKFTKALNESDKMSDGVIRKLADVADKCKHHKHLSSDKCETATLFVKCASEESVKIGYNSTDVAKTIRAIYLHVAIEKRGIFVPPRGKTYYKYEDVAPKYE